MLVGRDGECAQLRAILASSLEGLTQVVALRGDPGIGKTRLLEYVASVADQFRVVRVRGFETEREFPFAALSMIVGPLLAEATDLPAVQVAALEGALNLGPAVHGDRMGIAAATLAVLADAADRRPLLLTVDDVHLIDVPTMETLLFALRRIHTERLTVVLTARAERDVPSVVEQWLDPIRQIRLGGLDLAAARALTAHLGSLSPTLWTASGGNPLALLEMATPDSGAYLDEPLQLSARLLRAYGHRLTGLTAATREALLLLAVTGRANDILTDALAERGLAPTDLEPAEEAGLITVGPGDVQFRHPLVCSAVYHSASPAVRRAAHQAIAAAYRGRSAPGAAERQAFHLAAATWGPDEAVAGELAAAAAAAAARHSHTTAAALFEKAARLSPPGAARVERIIGAAMAGQAAGTLGIVDPLLALAITETDDPDLRTTAQHLQWRVQMWSGHPEQGQLVDRERVAPGQVRLAPQQQLLGGRRLAVDRKGDRVHDQDGQCLLIGQVLHQLGGPPSHPGGQPLLTQRDADHGGLRAHGGRPLRMPLLGSLGQLQQLVASLLGVAAPHLHAPLQVLRGRTQVGVVGLGDRQCQQRVH
ncbi:MAG TPA: AAA family ATPase, partial [Pseudonocardia sp.]|nr:AAA family ATPase [Pseudonocardia sp.]